MADVQRGPTVLGRAAKINRHDPCMLGISIGKGEAWLAKARAGWDWLNQEFNCTAVLIGDSLQRITIEITEASDPEEAAALAAKCSEDAAKSLAAFHPSPLVLRTSELCTRPEFPEALWRFTRLYDRHTQFRSAVDKDARSFCERQHRRGQLRMPLDEAMRLSSSYLIEEVAAYEVLAGSGWLTEAYFGSELTVLAQIMKGQLDGVSFLLEQRVHICLKYQKED